MTRPLLSDDDDDGGGVTAAAAAESVNINSSNNDDDSANGNISRSSINSRKVYSAAKKLEILNFMAKSSAKKACAEYSINPSMITRWRAKWEDISMAAEGRKRIGNSGRPPSRPVEEEMLMDWYMAKRQKEHQDYRVPYSLLRSKMERFCAEHDSGKKFNATKQWLLGLLRRQKGKIEITDIDWDDELELGVAVDAAGKNVKINVRGRGRPRKHPRIIVSDDDSDLDILNNGQLAGSNTSNQFGSPLLTTGNQLGSPLLIDSTAMGDSLDIINELEDDEDDDDFSEGDSLVIADDNDDTCAINNNHNDQCPHDHNDGNHENDNPNSKRKSNVFVTSDGTMIIDPRNLSPH